MECAKKEVGFIKENKYDDNKFFEEYSRFPRSVEGLTAAGEWHEFQKMLPDFEDKVVLDIGCGFGWHCAYAAEHGAAKVIGTDISEKMLAVADEKNAYPNVQYLNVAMEDIDFGDDTFDVVLSSLAFHYTPDFSDICRRINLCLKQGGDFVFSVEHPIFTAHGTQDWIYDSEGSPEYWPVNRYFSEGKRDAIFLGQRVTKYHKTMTTYLNTLLQTGFSIDKIVEPEPSKQMLETIPEMKNELHRPMMLLISAKKVRKI